jgi:sugar phosphate isomerase/epimerase
VIDTGPAVPSFAEMKRRAFLECSALAWAAFSAPVSFAAEAGAARHPRAVFTKFLEGLSFDELAERVSTLGVAGLEAPIRGGGHIEPKDVPEMLPEFVKALGRKNLKVLILSSDINEVDAGGKAEAVLRAAAGQGIKRYRLAHFKYDLGKSIEAQLVEIRAKLKDLADLNKELGIQGQYQNHRGNNYVGAPVWDILSVLEGIDPAHLGMAFDFAHATVEGSNAWELNFRRAVPHVVSVYFKDYRLDGGRWNACPLGEGMVNAKAGELVGELLPAATPVSLHIEYIGGNGEARTERIFEAMKKDLATLDKWLPRG